MFDTFKFFAKLFKESLKENGFSFFPAFFSLIANKVSLEKLRNTGPLKPKKSKFYVPERIIESSDLNNFKNGGKIDASYGKYEERKKSYLHHLVCNTNDTLMKGIAKTLLKETVQIKDGTVNKYCKRLNERLDCADFYAVVVAFALHIHKTTPFLSEKQFKMLKRALLGFKFWIDEPGFSKMIFWTENHQILFNTCELFAAELFPDEIFTNNRKDASGHKEHANKLILEWMDRRNRWGYYEWASSEYFDKDLAALILLAEAQDEQISESAKISLDILLLVISFDLFYGCCTSTHGRIYTKEILVGNNSNLSSIIKVIWDQQNFNEEECLSALMLAACTKYKPSEIIMELGQYNGELLTYEKSGISDKTLESIIKDYPDDRKIMCVWESGGFSNRNYLNYFIRFADKWNLWEHPFLELSGNLNRVVPRKADLKKITEGLDLEPDRIYMGEVNKVTHKTADYMLSSALDYMPGKMGNQHHIWQATLSPYAIVFTSNPGSFDELNPEIWPHSVNFCELNAYSQSKNLTPNYWVGQNRYPRVAQYKNLAIILYNIDTKKAVGESRVFDFTHIFFPRWSFDEVLEEGLWIFGRVNEGYIAFYSSRPYEQMNIDEKYKYDLKVNGTKNIYICQMGSRKEFGSFDSFVSSILRANLEIKIEKLNVNFTAPKVGKVSFSWEGDFFLDEQRIPMSRSGRIENSFCRSEYGSGKYEIIFGNKKLVLDHQKKQRRIELLNRAEITL